MQTSVGNPLEERLQEKEIDEMLLSDSLTKKKKVREMTAEELTDYRKIMRVRKKLLESKEEINKRRTSRRIAAIQYRDKNQSTDDDDGRVQSVNGIEIKTPTSCVLLCPKKPGPPKAFPIYSQGAVCGYLYTNDNQTLPTKVALTNIRSPTTPTLPENGKLISALRKQVLKASEKTTTPQFLATLNTMQLNNVPSNPLHLLQPANPLSLARVTKPMDNPKLLKLLNGGVPILPDPLKFQHILPVTMKTNNLKQSDSKSISFPTNNNNNNNPNKSNFDPPLLPRVACNGTNNIVQSTLPQSDTTPPGDLKSFLPLGKRDSDSSEFQKSKCKLRTMDQICVKEKPTEIESQFEKQCGQSKSEEQRKNCFSSNFVIKTELLNDEYENKFVICKTELREELEREEHQQQEREEEEQEREEEQQQQRVGEEQEQEGGGEEENGCGLVITSSFSLSDVSELHYAFENEAF